MDSLRHRPSDVVVEDDDDDDEMVDIAGATLDFSNTDDDPPLGSGECRVQPFELVLTCRYFLLIDHRTLLEAALVLCCALWPSRSHAFSESWSCIMRY